MAENRIYQFLKNFTCCQKLKLGLGRVKRPYRLSGSDPFGTFNLKTYDTCLTQCAPDNNK